jgi:peptidoglycan hydrolase CwlO-like protein
LLFHWPFSAAFLPAADISKIKMRKLFFFKILMLVSFATGSVFGIPFFLGSDRYTTIAQTEQQLLNKINDLEKKLENTKTQANSLSREINILENNVALTEAKIEQAEYQITAKEKELGVLKNDIRLLEIRLNRLEQ